MTNQLNAIKNRRSIRTYRPDPVPEELIRQILQAGILAPSSKNRQPWKFTVATGAARLEALHQMTQGLEREKSAPLIPESASHLSGARNTLRIMTEAPVLIFITNTLAQGFDRPLSCDDRVSEICNAQSIGAAIENMTLTATELGLGSLWICDTFFAQQELDAWIGDPGTLYAVLAVGYTDETPSPRPRRSLEDTAEWRR